MSFRARLTLLNMVIVGGVFLLFGAALYSAFSFALTNRVNAALVEAKSSIIDAIRGDQRGTLILINEPILDPTVDLYYQVWGRDGQLKYLSSNLSASNGHLAQVNLRPNLSLVQDVSMNGRRMRVMSVALAFMNNDRPIGLLQVGVSLTMVDTILQMLLVLLLVGSTVVVSLAGVVGWFSVRRALKPLNLVTETALQITRADDLSRRIPYQGAPDDEVGQLIVAFNQTLSRLEKLFNSQRRFLTDVGHELRTPLTVIKGNVDLMRRMDCTDDESMESIENEVDRLTRLVGDLLLLAQADSGKMPLVRRTVELDTLVLEVLQQMRVLAHDRIELRLGEIDQVLVCGDKDKLKQVLLNLVSNGIKYTLAGGEVTVGLSKDKKEARLTVSDTGPGIPEQDLPYIFDRFYRGEKSRTRSKDGKGFGLGLSIAYWIVRNHEGRIEASVNQPHGTTFCIWLPLAEGKCPDEITTPLK
jgi:two-component system, OmpR family, sensor kinase